MYLLTPAVFGGPNPILRLTFTGWTPNLSIMKSKVSPYHARARARDSVHNAIGNKQVASSLLRGVQQQNQGSVQRRLTINEEMLEIIAQPTRSTKIGEQVNSNREPPLVARRLQETSNSESIEAEISINTHNHMHSHGQTLTHASGLFPSLYRKVNEYLDSMRSDSVVLVLIVIFSGSLCFAVGILLSLHTYLGE